MDQGYVLITASHRQARNLSLAYASFMLEQGHSVWQTPLILPWKKWLIHAWDEGCQIHDTSRPRLLSSSQIRLLWLSIIDNSGFVDSKLQLNSIIDQAIHAYELCLEWNLEIFPEGLFLNADTRAFRNWVDTYRETMQRENWLEEQGLADYLINSTDFPKLPGVVVYGFDELNPQQQNYFNYLEKSGCRVEVFRPESKNKSTRYFEFSEFRNEIRAAATWAKNIVESDPQSSIGIVIPDLEQHRDYVTAVFDDILNPGWINKRPDSIQSLYSFAPGRPLSKYPVIFAALQILALGEYRQRIQRFDFLLRSSFIKGSESESRARARFYSALRATGEPAWRLNTLLNFIEDHGDNYPVATAFVAMLRALAVYLDQLPGNQSPRQWAESFTHCLTIFGWPGDRQLDSSEYQTLREWREKLLTFADLGSICGKLDYQQALEHLKRILSDTHFQPETPETPVQISGLPGIAGMDFEHLWIMDLHDLNWPGPASLNPFIPVKLQREVGIPGSSAEVNRKRCQRETQNLVSSTADLVFSFARMKEDTECRPSNILKQFTAEIPEYDVVDYKRLIFDSSKIELFTDTHAPEFSQEEVAEGGSGILTDQAACPFRAFARHRLSARGLDDIDIGLDPARRGLLVHSVMHGVWRRIGNSASLQAMTAAALETLLESVISIVIKQQARHQPETYSAGFCRLEGRRLLSLVKQWMEIERRRPGFTVLEMEKKLQVNFYGLSLRMRLDHIDEYEIGGYAVKDYKTGDVNVLKWQGERPEEPQLPLYAVTHGGQIKAVAYAGMKKGRLAFTGLGEDPELIEGVVPVSEIVTEDSWRKHLSDWESNLEKLAEEYLHGEAGVMPRDNKACQYCDLHTLCRIHERKWFISDNTGDSLPQD